MPRADWARSRAGSARWRAEQVQRAASVFLGARSAVALAQVAASALRAWSNWSIARSRLRAERDDPAWTAALDAHTEEIEIVREGHGTFGYVFYVMRKPA